MLEVRKLKLDGLLELRPKRFGDDRGFFSETWNRASFAEAGITSLPKLRDPKSELARNMGVLGLPLTVILNPEGQEIARMIGDADWNSADAKAMLTALIAP